MDLNRKNPKRLRVGDRIILLNGVDKLSYFDLTKKKLFTWKKFEKRKK